MLETKMESTSCLMNQNLLSPFNYSVKNSHYPDLMINEFLELNEKISRYSFNSSLTLRSHSNARVFFF
jgi:hypothetical protein